MITLLWSIDDTVTPRVPGSRVPADDQTFQK